MRLAIGALALAFPCCTTENAAVWCSSVEVDLSVRVDSQQGPVEGATVLVRDTLSPKAGERQRIIGNTNGAGEVHGHFWLSWSEKTKEHERPKTKQVFQIVIKKTGCVDVARETDMSTGQRTATGGLIIAESIAIECDQQTLPDLDES
jgi:hypothetical protein